jgi:hypothetical protein
MLLPLCSTKQIYGFKVRTFNKLDIFLHFLLYKLKTHTPISPLTPPAPPKRHMIGVPITYPFTKNKIKFVYPDLNLMEKI